MKHWPRQLQISSVTAVGSFLRLTSSTSHECPNQRGQDEPCRDTEGKWQLSRGLITNLDRILGSRVLQWLACACTREQRRASGAEAQARIPKWLPSVMSTTSMRGARQEAVLEGESTATRCSTLVNCRSRSQNNTLQLLAVTAFHIVPRPPSR